MKITIVIQYDKRQLKLSPDVEMVKRMAEGYLATFAKSSEVGGPFALLDDVDLRAQELARVLANC
jgi:hypothetical protein